MKEFWDFSSSSVWICWRRKSILKKGNHYINNKNHNLSKYKLKKNNQFFDTNLCSWSVACISVSLTIDRAVFSSAETRVHCKLPIVWASSLSFCACDKTKTSLQVYNLVRSLIKKVNSERQTCQFTCFSKMSAGNALTCCVKSSR